MDHIQVRSSCVVLRLTIQRWEWMLRADFPRGSFDGNWLLQHSLKPAWTNLYVNVIHHDSTSLSYLMSSFFFPCCPLADLIKWTMKLQAWAKKEKTYRRHLALRTAHHVAPMPSKDLSCMLTFSSLLIMNNPWSILGWGAKGLKIRLGNWSWDLQTSSFTIFCWLL